MEGWLKSDQGSLDPVVSGCLEYPSSSTSGVGVPDLRMSSPSLPISFWLSPPPSSSPLFFFFSFFCRRLRKPANLPILKI